MRGDRPASGVQLLLFRSSTAAATSTATKGAATATTAQMLGLGRYCGLESSRLRRHRTNCVLDISVKNNSGTQVSHNVNPFVAPKHMAKSLPKAVVSFTVETSGAITLTTTATALYVVLTTAATGRFSDNAFLLEASEPKVIEFVSWTPGGMDATQLAVLKSSLRVEHLQENLGQ